MSFWRQEEPELELQLEDDSVIQGITSKPLLIQRPGGEVELSLGKVVTGDIICVGEVWQKVIRKAVAKGGFLGHQREWWKKPNFVKALVAGYGAGKTITCCKWAIAMCLENAPAPVGLVSPTYPLARKTTIETIIALLAGKKTILGGELNWRYNKNEHTFYIQYHGRKGTIFIMSGDDADSLRGPNLAAAGIDEPFIQERTVLDQMVARIRHPDAKTKQLGLFGTPEQLNWGYDLCVGQLEGVADPKLLDVALVQASTRDNPTVGEDYVGRLEGVLTKEAVAAYVDGAFINLSTGRVYYGFKGLNSPNVVELEEPKHEHDGSPAAELGVGMDFNVNPMSAAVFWRFRDHIHFFDELELPNADTEFMCSVLKERYSVRLRNVYPDASGSARHSSAPQGKTDYFYIRDAGFNIIAPHANPKKKDRYNAVNGKFSPKAGACTLTVSPKCKKLIKYLGLHSYELMTKEEQKKMTHLLDAFSYPVSQLFPVVKEQVVGRIEGS